MKALILLDMQNCILNERPFENEKENICKLIDGFKQKGEPVIFTRHIDRENNESPFYINSKGSEISDEYLKYVDCVINKTTPSAFVGTELKEILEKKGIDHVVIAGFNTEFCCMFTAIAAYDRGYKVTFVEDATGTVNTEETYEMEGLDIKDFVGSVLNWSGVIEDLYFQEYLETYN